MRPHAASISFIVVGGLLALVVAGCSPAGGGGSGDAGGQTGDAGGGDPGTAPDAESTGQIGDSCERATQCEGELICDPEAEVCTDAVACEDHDDCGLGSHCGESDECTQSGNAAPCADDDNCASGDECLGGFCGCAGDTFEAELVDVNMMILLDRSGSMNRDLDEGEWVEYDDERSRWQIARGALDTALAEYEDRANLGFSVYPDGSGCTPGVVNVEISGDTTTEDILSAFDGLHPPRAGEPVARTPSGPSLRSVGDEDNTPELHRADSENVILYITDGAENCGDPVTEPPDSEDSQVTVAGELREAGISTFVVGFSDDISPEELNDTAQAAGTARDVDGEPDFYLAGDAEALEEALDEIGGKALGCTYPLGDNAPSNPDNLTVYADGQTIARDDEQGWSYDEGENEVIVHGDLCDDVTTGAVEDVTIVQSCDVVIE